MGNNRIIRFLSKHVPFSYIWLIRNLVGANHKSVLDIGCGTGHFMDLIRRKDWKITGIDIHKKTAKEALESGIYKEVLVGDLVKECQRLVLSRKKYDLVFCSQVIEHIDRKQGLKLLDLMDKLHKKKIYVGTPRGYMEQPEEYIGENKYQRHKSGWSELDFTARGYKVYGVGFDLFWSENGIARRFNRFGMFFVMVVSFLMSPVSFFVPSLASGIMAIKSIKN